MEIADWASDPDILFDQPQPEDVTPLIASGNSRYRQQADKLMEYHTGASNNYLSAQECYDLSIVKQAGVIAKETLLAIDENGQAVGEDERRALEIKVQAGRQARTTMIEGNLKWAAYLARASMNILPSSKRADLERGRTIGAYGDITKLANAHAVLEDRIQVANEGLIKAVDKFQPKINIKGRPTALTTYSAWYIQRSIEKYAIEHEPHGIRLSTSLDSEANNAWYDP